MRNQTSPFLMLSNKFKPMNTKLFFIILSSLLLFVSCSSSNTIDEYILDDTIDDIKSNSSQLISIEFEYEQSIFDGSVSNNEIVVERKLPFEAKEIKIKSISMSTNATSNLTIGNVISLSNNQEFTVTAEDGVTKSTYAISFQVNEYASIVEKHGLLTVNGNKIVDKNNEVVSLAGNSFFWTNNNWGGLKYYKASVVSWLKLDWNTTIVRAAMGVEDSGGYLDAKTANKNRLKTIVDAAIDQGLYVIIDWHSHHAEDNVNEAVAFFEEMATTYGNHPNIIYEIYNEPLNVSWDDTIKPYAETVINAIRAIDPDNLIVVGTPEWSQRVDLAANNPITNYSNIAYTLHFYSVHHQQWLRDRADEALEKGIALFITEWGVLGYTQDDPETDQWMQWCKDNQLIHCSWAVNDKEEEWSIVKPNSNTNGNWDDNKLTEAGKLTRKINREWNL
jgi:hypothetical protein